MVHPSLAGSDLLLAGEPATAELSSWLDAIAEITRAAIRDAPLDELMDLIAGATAHLTGYDFCAVFEADLERRALIIKGSYGLSQTYIDTINARTPILLRAGDTGEGPSSRAFRSQRPTTVLDIAADAPSRSWETVAAQQGYSSLLAVPLVVGQTPFGLITCYTAEKHEFSAREIILMESMANQAGLAIETARRLAESQARADGAAEEAASLLADLEAQRHADANHRELLRVVLRGGGLTAIAESLGSMLRCTVAIDDAAGRLLASAGSTGRPGTRDRRVAATYEQARERVGKELDLETVVIPAAPGEPGGTEGVVVPVVLDEEVAGHLWALQPRAPFGPPQRQALTRAAAVVSLALLKERTAQEVEWRLSRDFFDDLFDAEGQSADALRARARQLGADLSRRHTVLVIRRDPAEESTGALQDDREAYAQRSLLSLVQRTGGGWGGATLTATRSDHVVVLWDDAEPNRSALEFAEHLSREIQAYASGWTATICVGPSCADVREYGDAYRLTCGVLDLVQQSDRRDRIVSLDSIGAYRLLLQVKRPQELQSFAESMLGTVHVYDRKHQTQLGATLRAYMANRCNVSVTAKALHVHPNTVAYRLRRVEELLGIDLSDPQAMLHLQLALMIERILGE
ncbi:GAF domain-containing protein [Blastococcus sp. CT_GayMR19]|uniref:helix-turn-helix domain-containing protein n=1 Tax=Blastococcus sp. CT_GayMR19 TaxID=2559608 RepID=UPI00107335E8|nr:helix-turn-helix domain-containing protein [Blastococcus sp. CT_GayMR19]TFV70129.1 GAF domain-containing protein [Blastococcus sp. CT_GayMR19]